MTTNHGVSTSPPPIELNAAFADSIHHGVSDAIATMFGLTAEHSPHEMLSHLEAGGNISGMVTLKQTSPEGILLISFPRTTLASMLKILYKADVAADESKLRMGAGELTNVIYSVLKATLNKNGFKLKMALPTVAMPDARIDFKCPGTQVMRIPFQTSIGTFQIIISRGCNPVTSMAA